MMAKLSVIIPVYNEKDTIVEIIRRVRSVDFEKELVVVDDGSADGTMDILKEGRGSHFDSALLDAFAQIARTLYDKFTEGDDQTPKKELDAIIQEYFAGDFSLLYR